MDGNVGTRLLIVSILLLILYAAAPSDRAGANPRRRQRAEAGRSNEPASPSRVLRAQRLQVHGTFVRRPAAA